MPGSRTRHPGRTLASSALALGASLLVGCGGGGGSTDTTPPPTKGERALVPTKAKPVTVAVRALNPGGPAHPKLARSATAQAGNPVQAVVRVFSGSAGNGLTVRLRRVGPTRWRLGAELASGGAAQGVITVPKGLELARLAYACHLAPTTFCPVRATRSKPGDVKLRLQAHTTPVGLALDFDRAKKIPKPRLAKLGGPSAPVKVLLEAQELPAQGKPPPPATDVKVSTGSRARFLLRPVPGSGTGPTEISVMPRQGGEAIEARVRGRSVATAKLRGRDGPIVLANPVWGCALPPGTFCPFSEAKRVGPGFRFRLPLPRVAVAVVFDVRKG